MTILFDFNRTGVEALLFRYGSEDVPNVGVCLGIAIEDVLKEAGVAWRKVEDPIAESKGTARENGGYRLELVFSSAALDVLNDRSRGRGAVPYLQETLDSEWTLGNRLWKWLDGQVKVLSVS